MSVAFAEPPPAAAADPDALRDGMRMNRAEFHRRYLRMDRIDPSFRAELIEGVVHLRDPMSASEPHATFQQWISAWCYEYLKRTPGLKSLVAPTVLLDDDAEPEPDVMLRRRVPGEDATGYVDRTPEFVVEVSVSTLRKDLGPKFRDYQRAGVPEYLVVDVTGERLHWFVRDADGLLVDLPPDADGLLKSREFPGLWLDPAAFFAEDAAGIEAAVAAGVAARDAA